MTAYMSMCVRIFQPDDIDNRNEDETRSAGMFFRKGGRAKLLRDTRNSLGRATEAPSAPAIQSVFPRVALWNGRRVHVSVVVVSSARQSN